MTRNACSNTAPSIFVRRFTAERATPGRARKATREFLCHRAAEDEIDTAVLLVSEIATNSVIASERIKHAHISLTLRVAGTLLFAGITDAAPGLPKASEPAPGDDSGYGLFIVSQLSQRHGWFPMSNRQKCTYFLLDLDGSTGNGQMTGPAMTIESDIIKAWVNSQSTAKKIAADLAIRIEAGKIERYHDLPSSDDLAAKWSVSPGTALKAKQLLKEQELVKVEGGRYTVA